jgi:hypothetical protein
MRIAFTLAILGLSAVYTYAAFADLPFLSSAGRLGPGFFPRIIGLGLVVFTLWNLYADLKRRQQEEDLSPFWGVTLTIALLSGFLVAGLELLGGVLAMVLFMLASLFYLNRRQPVLNVAVSILLPVGFYLLFRVWLKAAMPEDLIPLPI